MIAQPQTKLPNLHLAVTMELGQSKGQEKIFVSIFLKVYKQKQTHSNLLVWHHFGS